MENKTYATARVQITLELPAASTWGKDCPIDQIYRQAGEETINGLKQLLFSKYGSSSVRIIDSRVTAVIATRE